jgi:hypothetical protein
MAVVVGRSKQYSSPFLRKTMIYGALAKLISGQLLCMLYIFYYKYGDTLRFFRFGEYYKEILFNSSEFNFIQWIFLKNEVFKNLVSYKIDYAYGFGESSFLVNKFSGIISLFTFGSYMSITLFFSILSFSGSWMLYLTFCKIYPKLYKDFAVAIVVFPSVVFWGSGVLKDSLCIFSLGWLTYGLYSLLLAGKVEASKVPRYLVIIVLSFSLIVKIKIYLAVAFSAGFIIWLLFFYKDKIHNRALKAIVTPLLLTVSIPVIIVGLQYFSDILGRYALENIVETALNLSVVQQNKGDAGSTYSLGDMDPSVTGLLRKVPAAMNVTLFRPYLWEARNPIMIFAALESLFVLFVSFSTLRHVGVFKSVSAIFNNGTLLFCFVYSFLFSIAVGISSANFGTLMRYKIPSMPFYMIGIFILYYINMGHSFFDRKKYLEEAKKKASQGKVALKT